MLYQREFQNNEEPAKHHISCFGYETEADRQYPTHCHAYYEISYLVSGERYQIINGQRYKVEPGSFFLFSPLCMHGYHNITECQDLVIQFSSDFLYQVSSSLQKCFLQALFGQSCKTFLDIIASPNWTKLQSLDWQLSCQPHSHCRQYLVVTA